MLDVTENVYSKLVLYMHVINSCYFYQHLFIVRNCEFQEMNFRPIFRYMINKRLNDFARYICV